MHKEKIEKLRRHPNTWIKTGIMASRLGVYRSSPFTAHVHHTGLLSYTDIKQLTTSLEKYIIGDQNYICSTAYSVHVWSRHL